MWSWHKCLWHQVGGRFSIVLNDIGPSVVLKLAICNIFFYSEHCLSSESLNVGKDSWIWTVMNLLERICLEYQNKIVIFHFFSSLFFPIFILVISSNYQTCLGLLMHYPPIGDVHSLILRALFLRDPKVRCLLCK